MVILFTATNISEQHQKKLEASYPKQTFIFCENKSEVEQHIEKAEVVVTYGADLTDDLLATAQKLKWIKVISAGVEDLPVQTISDRNILVTNVSGIHKVPMAEYVISMLLHVYRSEKLLVERQAEVNWDRSIRTNEITGRTMVVLGTGAIGQEVARLAKAFQMDTIGVSRSGRAVEYFDETYKINQLTTMLGEADFVISVLPSTAETKGLFTYDHFQAMSDHAVFLNMGRGDLVPSDDLVKSLQQKEIAHAVLDVFEEEPLPEDHPLWQEERVTITPHVSGVTPQYQDRALCIFEHNLDIYLKGTDTYINKIDVTRGY